jgi:hypothetical protein
VSLKRLQQKKLTRNKEILLVGANDYGDVTDGLEFQTTSNEGASKLRRRFTDVREI